MKVSFLVFFPLHTINLFALLLSEQTNVWWPLQGFKLMSKPYKRCWVPSTWWGFMKTKMIHYLSILFNQLDFILATSWEFSIQGKLGSFTTVLVIFQCLFWRVWRMVWSYIFSGLESMLKIVKIAMWKELERFLFERYWEQCNLSTIYLLRRMLVFCTAETLNKELSRSVSSLISVIFVV